LLSLLLNLNALCQIFIKIHIKNNLYLANMQSFIFIIVLAAFTSGVSFFFLTNSNSSNYSNVAGTIFQKSISSNIKDSQGDTKLVPLYKTSIIPEVKDYHDILSASVTQISDKNTDDNRCSRRSQSK
jgi:hypothetical protein